MIPPKGLRRFSLSPQKELLVAGRATGGKGERTNNHTPTKVNGPLASHTSPRQHGQYHEAMRSWNYDNYKVSALVNSWAVPVDPNQPINAPPIPVNVHETTGPCADIH